MTVPTEVVAVSTTETSEVTVTVCSTAPSVSWKFCTTVRATSRLSELATCVWNPCARTSTR
jgi:hypothetical protein